MGVAESGTNAIGVVDNEPAFRHSNPLTFEACVRSIRGSVRRAPTEPPSAMLPEPPATRKAETKVRRPSLLDSKEIHLIPCGELAPATEFSFRGLEVVPGGERTLIGDRSGWAGFGRQEVGARGQGNDVKRGSRKPVVFYMVKHREV